MLVGVPNKVLPSTTVFLEDGDVVGGTGGDLEVPSGVTFFLWIMKESCELDFFGVIGFVVSMARFLETTVGGFA